MDYSPKNENSLSWFQKYITFFCGTQRRFFLNVGNQIDIPIVPTKQESVTSIWNNLTKHIAVNKLFFYNAGIKIGSFRSHNTPDPCSHLSLSQNMLRKTRQQ